MSAKFKRPDQPERKKNSHIKRVMGNPKKLLVLGATGSTGKLFVDKALAAGHSLTIYARSPDKLSEEVRKNQNVTVSSWV